MVFVHARNATVQTAMWLRESAKNMGDTGLFTPSQSADYGQAQKQVGTSAFPSTSTFFLSILEKEVCTVWVQLMGQVQALK